MTPGQHALVEAMRLEQARVYGATVREPQRRRDTLTADDLARITKDTPQAIVERRRVLREVSWTNQTREQAVRISRQAIEQHIARGRQNEQIAEELLVDVDQVAAVRAEMDRRAS
jgi:transcription initiation factor TFIIIB Brf1 subunit/transcription initiation factor TFIIB